MSTVSSPNPNTDQILELVADCLTPEVARRILGVAISPQVQSRVDELAAKAAEDRLSGAERDEYEDLIERADLLGILKSLSRQVLARQGA
ncbi:MAG: hypothetical protein DWQ34_22515 [Planctomycetota bacterium]|nr:MAG: hypothetical protein DWQ34_22515 [Planctomycetota bacterium]REK30674.1 MAG: hypothetical protein DWQ41_01630 [Planctomycetota bacterium]REK33048.1 MAG: hypothetical protein DWQ45_15730 [Planctomycetota bacterium]